MADVSKINIDGLTFNIKDTVARNEVNSRSFILIGDSFGGGVINATTNGNGWINHFKQYTENKYKVYNSQTPLGGVYGFASSRPFLDVLKDCETQIEDNNTITDIVVLGGTNDLGVNRALIEPAIKTFTEYCHANFPKALVKIGLVGTAINSLYELVPYYRTCNKYGCVFVQDTLCLMNDTSLISDGTHLTQDGYDLYDPYICDAILSGRCYYRFVYDLNVTSNLITKARLYLEITEKGFMITFLNETTESLNATLFNITPTAPSPFTLAIGTINVPKLFLYYFRVANGYTNEIISMDNSCVVSPIRPFSVWIEPNGVLNARFGTPFYDDTQKSQIGTFFSETYTYLV